MKRITQEEWLMRAALALGGVALGAVFESRTATAATCLSLQIVVLLAVHMPAKRKPNGKSKAQNK
jgi:hypothetical protein